MSEVAVTHKSVRPLKDWLTLRLDKVAEPQKGEFWVPPSQEDRVRTGVIVQAGPGRTSKKGNIIPMEAKVGMRVAFFRENFETMHGRTIAGYLRKLDENIGLIQERDILYVIED